MRLCLLALLASLAFSASAQDWTAIPVGTTGTLRAIENASFSQKYLAGDGGFVALSNPDRTVWTPVNVGTTADLYAVIRPTSTQAWVSGAAGVVRVRDVAGVWHVRDIPSTETFVLFTRSSGQALAAGSGGSIWKSVNGGVDWVLQNSGTTTPLHAGIGGTFGTGWVVGDDGLLLRSDDNGATWAPVASGTTRDLHSVRYGPGTSLFAVGAGGTIIASTDDGATWTPRASGTTRTLRDFSTSGQNANWMMAVGDDGVALKSTDGGALWCRMTTGAAADLYAVAMITNSEHVVAGENGLLLRTTTSGGTCLPSVDVTLQRIGTGSIPPGGGPITFTVALANPSPEVQTFEAWVDAVIPGGSTFGPFLGPQQVTLNPGQSVGPIQFTRQVPGNAPPGTYTVRLRAGDFPSALLDESTFLFSKTAAVGEGSAETLAGALGSRAVFLPVPGVSASTANGAVLSPIRPNPAREGASFTLTVDRTQHVAAAVYDVQGRRVAAVFVGEAVSGVPLDLPLDAGGLVPGVYVVRVQGETFAESRRLVVIR
jgi:photosystem II stability/assembly factor-like uncharacterized protein